MRTVRRLGTALLLALAFTSTVHAQTGDDRLSLNAVVGPSFANVGTTFSALGNVGYAVNDRVSLVGEAGLLRHAPFGEAADIAPSLAVPGGSEARVNGMHWNGNIAWRPIEIGRLRPYVTGGIGAFTADTIVSDRREGNLTVEDRRRVTDFSTNVGAGALYPLTDWVGLGADYRTFFVHRDGETPRVHRFTGGLTFSLK
jgi:Outer membrane protein beta-barrel domain